MFRVSRVGIRGLGFFCPRCLGLRVPEGGGGGLWAKMEVGISTTSAPLMVSIARCIAIKMILLMM